jgi:hypothetical protein
MPAAAIERDIAFINAPFAAGTFVGNKVRIIVPAGFDTASANFSVCLFMHGVDALGFRREAQIAAAAKQLATGQTKALFVAPRFADINAGRFDTERGFLNFIAELEPTLGKVLQQAGVDVAQAQEIGRRAAKDAQLVLAPYSGGHKPLRAILTRMTTHLAGLPESERSAWTKRLDTILLLDAIFGGKQGDAVVSTAVNEIGKWMDRHGGRTLLVSIFGEHTGDQAPAANRLLMQRLSNTMVTSLPLSWPNPPPPLQAGSATFHEVATDHFTLLAKGPPADPIAAFLARL